MDLSVEEKPALWFVADAKVLRGGRGNVPADQIDAPSSLPRPVQRRRRRAILALVVLLGVPLSAAIDGFVIEPHWLEVTQHTVSSSVRTPLKIAQLSDLHLHDADSFMARSVRAALDEQRPDVIVLTGDLYDSVDGKVAAEAFIATLKAPLGVWYVPGNWEHWTLPAAAAYLDTSAASTVLNAAVPLRDDVWLAGFDDATAGTPLLQEALSSVPADVVTVGIFHSPAFFTQAAPRLTLSLAGHTHGGQVRLPGLPPLWLPPGSGAFVHGWYGDDEHRLYVSRGIGTSMLPVRFFCRPELTVVTLVPR